MIELHPNYLTKNGKKEFVVLPYEEFLAIQELLDDLEDLKDLRTAKQEEYEQPTITIAEVKQMLSE
jgi:PHD/YefM family antitoxin component YafN of YafNO toxin-antitoxin module